MPVRVKTENGISRPWTRRDSRESLSSTDHLIAVYSLESKEASFEASTATMEAIQHKHSVANDTFTSDAAGIETISSASWVKTPWAVCFPPQLQANVQQISERLNLEQPKLVGDASTPESTSLPASSHSSKSKHKPYQPQQTSAFSVTCGYGGLEQKDDGDANNRVLHIEQSDHTGIHDSNLAFSDDDSVTSWTSQNAVKFNKKLKPKAADAHCVKETNNSAVAPGVTATELTVPASFWDAWAAKPSEISKKSHRKPTRKISQPQNEASITLLPEKRDENEAWSDQLTPHPRQIQEDGSVHSDVPIANVAPVVNQPVCKKSVRFTNPLVTSQHYRPKTRPEEVSLLYFDEDELEILEEDRETTSRDQFEMIAQELSENRLRISIAYQNRWRDRRRHSSSTSSVSASGVQVSMSASDV